MDYRQDPPFSVQIELVEGCTLSCEFCGINGIREKPGNFKFMSLHTASVLAADLREATKHHGWNPRIEFAMHGEPSMHPQRAELVGIFREALPRASIVMFSNGSGFVKDTTAAIDGILEAGVNTLGLDAYEHVNIVPRILEAYKGTAPIYYYPQQPEHNLHSGRRVGHRDIVVIQDISKAKSGNHSSLNTHCGGGLPPPREPVAKRCAKPFREIAIRWDGNVALCCNDFRGVYKIGNIFDTRLYDLWQHPAFMAARKKLYHRDRGFAPCQWCDATSMRVGLLPDHKGLLELPVASPDDVAAIATATAGDPYTAPVRRGWEVSAEAAFNPLPGKVYPLNILDAKKKLKS